MVGMERVANEEQVKRHYALLDILLLIFWFLLTGIFLTVWRLEKFPLFPFLAGLICASIVTLTAHEFVIRGRIREKSSLMEYFRALRNVITLFVDVILRLIVANGVLVYQALTMDIEPRIVRIKVDLTSESEVTLISMLITLIPGTVVIDVEEECGKYYLFIHYSYLRSENLVESMEDTIKRWDGKIRGIFR